LGKSGENYKYTTLKKNLSELAPRWTGVHVDERKPWQRGKGWT